MQDSVSAQGYTRKRGAQEAGLLEGQQSELQAVDNYPELFGRAEPRHIPESGAWKRERGTPNS